MAEQPVASFAGLLRYLRTEAGLTQEELAEAATLSPRSISDLERGINLTARKDTARLLADALHLDGQARTLFEAAARGRVPAADALAAAHSAAARATAAVTRTLPREVASFTGRHGELAQLMAQWAESVAGSGVVSIHAIGGMAGIGKTTFAVHAAHRLAGDFPDGQFFLPLHAHTPGQQPVGSADALSSLLLTAGLPASQIPPDVDARAGRWRDYVAGKRILLLLDDAAGHEQVRPLLPGTPGSLVLITSRRRLTALEDAAVLSLDALSSDEAAALLARLADRPDLDSSDGPAGQITRLCGYLPLAIGMLGRQLAHHPAWTAERLATDLAAARDRLELIAAENLSVAAAFDLSYQDLTEAQRRLFRRLGLHPGPDIDAHAAAALDDATTEEARRRLEDLYDQHLITQPADGRYRFHDLIREHARALADDPADADATTCRLLDFYAGTALAASKHIATRMIAASPPPSSPPPPVSAPPVSTPVQATAWMETERVNLHAVAGYAGAHAYPQHVITVSAAMAGFLHARGHWDQAAALHFGAVSAAGAVGDRTSQARALNDLGVMQGMVGDYPASDASVSEALALYRELGDRAGEACALNNLGMVQHYTGRLQAAIANHHQALDLFRELGHRHGQGSALQQLGAIHTLSGDYAAAAANLRQALELFQDIGLQLSQGDTLIELATVQGLTGDYQAATATQQQALELFGGLGDRYGEAHVIVERGVVETLSGDYRAAVASLHQASDLFRELGDRQDLAWALNELGVAQRLAGDYQAAAANFRQALELFRETSGQVGEADALINLGELLSRTSGSQQAREHYAQALVIARDLGAPKEEAQALEGIGQADVHDGNTTEGASKLRRALAIFQRLGVPDAQRIEETLRDLGL
jgi:tetratricopeptide (TPR) repeat protein/transcriptional regulator with XRE-family HTH domain